MGELMEEMIDGVRDRSTAYGDMHYTPGTWVLNLLDGLGELSSDVLMNEEEGLIVKEDWACYREGLLDIAIGAILAIKDFDRSEVTGYGTSGGTKTTKEEKDG